MDSPRVRDFLAEQERHVPIENQMQKEITEKGKAADKFEPDPIVPERVKLIEDLMQEPATFIPARSEARLLKASAAKCRGNLFDRSSYIKIRVTSGSARGAEGWVCDADLFINGPIFP